MDDLNSFLPQANEIDFAEDWKLLANFSPSNFFIPLFLSLITLLFGIGYVAGYFADKRMARDLEALEQRMYLLGGDVTTDFHEKAEDKTRNCKQKCWSYWKCWECNKVRFCNGAHPRKPLAPINHTSAHSFNLLLPTHCTKELGINKLAPPILPLCNIV